MPNLVPNRVLYIEDDPAQATLLKELLRETTSGACEVDSAGSLSEAMKLLESVRYDLILLDLGLPDSQGLETFTKAKAWAGATPIIVLSGMDDEEAALRALQEGAEDYVVKGRVDYSTMWRTIRHAIERARIREELRWERDLLHAVIEAMPVEVYVKDRECRFMLANRPVARFFGVSEPEALYGKTDSDLFQQKNAQGFLEEDLEIVRTGRMLMDRESLLRDNEGRAHWVVTSKAPFRDRHGHILGTVGVNRDITDIKEAETRVARANEDLRTSKDELQRTLDELRKAHVELQNAQLYLVEAEKLKIVGRLAASVAHEVKNPLSIVLRGVELLMRLTPGRDAEVSEVLADMKESIQQADGIMRGLLDFSVPRQIVADSHDLNGLVRQALRLMHHEFLRRRITVETDLVADLPAVPFDSQKISEVFLNLFENAADAMPDGGILRMRTSARPLVDFRKSPAGKKLRHLEVGDLVLCAEIEDSGTGIPENILTQIGEPFFTTKPNGKGTGLGLAVCKTIVELHGGILDLQNRPDGGVRATLAFALNEKSKP